MSNSLQYIYQHPLFSENDLERIFSAHQKIEVKKNEFLLKEGQIADCYYLLEKA